MKKGTKLFNQKQSKIFEILQTLTSNSAELEKLLDKAGKFHLAHLMLALSAIGEADLKRKG